MAVYGTLRHGGSNHAFLQQAKLLGTESVPGFDLHTLGRYPAISPGSGQLVIEIYAIDEPLLKRLDRLEEFDPQAPDQSEYLRVSIQTSQGPAWIYVYNRPLDTFPLIPSGDWIKHAHS